LRTVQAGGWIMAAASEADLAEERRAVSALLEEMRQPPSSVPPSRARKMGGIVECATGSGWQRVGLHADPELPDTVPGDAGARDALLAQWQAQLADCRYD
jgi:hypothetical protein